MLISQLSCDPFKQHYESSGRKLNLRPEIARFKRGNYVWNVGSGH